MSGRNTINQRITTILLNSQVVMDLGLPIKRQDMRFSEKRAWRYPSDWLHLVLCFQACGPRGPFMFLIE
jgi:hypothetical protein